METEPNVDIKAAAYDNEGSIFGYGEDVEGTPTRLR
jgi:hypothetical protein